MVHADRNKKRIKISDEQLKYAVAIAASRAKKKKWNETENTARENFLGTLDDDFDVVLTDESGNKIIEVRESISRGAIDWAQVEKAYPEIDFEAFRKASHSTVTVTIGDTTAHHVNANLDSLVEDPDTDV